MGSALNAHGALLAIEKDADPSGTFTTIAELMDLSNILDITRSTQEVTPHNDTVSNHVVGPMVHGEWSFSVSFVFDNATHDHLTGLQKRHYDGDKFGVQLLGPSGSAGSHEVICSGYITNLSRSYATGANAVGMDVTFQPVGKFIVDAASYGTVG